MDTPNILLARNTREMFWDDYLVDSEKTTAFPRLLQPIRKEICFEFDQGAEQELISYPCIVNEENDYRMYYLPWRTDENGSCMGYLALIESVDGIHWKRAHLNSFSRPDLKENNVVIDNIVEGIFVFKDTNPNCDPEEQYKAITSRETEGELLGGLWCYTSPDGYRFKRSHNMTTVGTFDTLNVAFWDNDRYVCYLRNYHNIAGDTWNDGIEDFNIRNEMTTWENINAGIRDIRVMYSEDFRTWTEPKRIEFFDGKDYPLYTSNVIKYPRAPHIKIGFPVRYVERKVWTDNCEQIGSAALKKEILATGGVHSKRESLAVTDAIFMFSRDGERWSRFNEAFFTPGYETDRNWIYGDCYSAYNLIDSGHEVYYMYERGCQHSSGCAKPLYRYEIRKDGFACWMADGEERVLVTKPMIFNGDDLHLNFSTSAAGHIYVDVLDEFGDPIDGASSFEIFGDTIDRTIYLETGERFGKYSDTPIRLRFRMLEAKLYSLWLS